MYLYVANTLRQNQRVHYRIDVYDRRGGENAAQIPANHHDIGAGQQVRLGNEDFASLETIDYIKKQLGRYGMIDCQEVGKIRHGAVVPLICNVGAPVPLRAIDTMIAINLGITATAGKERREKAAVVLNTAVEQATARKLEQEHFDPAKAPMTGFAVELEEQEGGSRNPDAPMLGEGYGSGKLDPRGPNAPPLPPAPAAKGGGKNRGSRAA